MGDFTHEITYTAVYVGITRDVLCVIKLKGRISEDYVIRRLKEEIIHSLEIFIRSTFELL